MERLLELGNTAQEYDIPRLLLDPEERKRELRSAVEEYLALRPVPQDRSQTDVVVFSENSISFIELKTWSSSYPRMSSALLQKASIRFLKWWREVEQEDPYLTRSEMAEDLLGGSYSRTVVIGGSYDVDIVPGIVLGAAGSGKSTAVIAFAKALYTFASACQSTRGDEFCQHDEMARLLIDWYYRDIFREQLRDWLRRNSSRLIRQAIDTSRCRHIFQRMFNRRFRNSRRSRRLLRQHANHTFLMLWGDAFEWRFAPIGTSTQDQGTARHQTWQT